MLIIDGTIGSDIPALLHRIAQETDIRSIMTYYEWLSHGNCSHHEQPDGIIYLRVLPSIAYARLQKRGLESEKTITLDEIEQVYIEKEQLFIENKNSPAALKDLPVLVLNGNIDFQTDFAQFYNHLFYIKRLLKQIQEKKEMALGIYKEKAPHRHCC